MSKPLEYTLIFEESSWNETLWAFYLGAYGSDRYLVFGGSLDAALETLVEYLVDEGSDHVFTAEQALEQVGEEPTEENYRRLDEGEFDISLVHGGYKGSWYMTSYEWSVNEITGGQLYDLAREEADEWGEDIDDDRTSVEIEFTP